jgi:hypothetical protein
MQVTASFHKSEIVIPADKNWFLVIVFAPVILVWAFIEIIVVPVIIISNLKNNFELPLFWFIGWTAWGLFAIKLWLWHVAGKTVFHIHDKTLTIQKRRNLFSKPKHYQIDKIANLHIQNRDIERTKYFTRPNYLFTDKTKTVAFEYESVVIRAVDWLTEKDATTVLSKLKELLYTR